MVTKQPRKAPRKTPAQRAARAPSARKARIPRSVASQRTARLGRIIALGSLVAAGALLVIGAGAIVLLATDPARRSSRWGGWNVNTLSNAARKSLAANVPASWQKTVREDLLPEAREFVTRQAKRFG
ncbi:MAG TPA: hypothetical protein VL026_02155 [Rhizomicrobium sp.]|nr:hypothetical protein [Rhizomicrobium sp.]